jgi:excinuclease ABC subunit B
MEETKDQKKFELQSDYSPTGDQPQAIEKLTEGILDGKNIN